MIFGFVTNLSFKQQRQKNITASCVHLTKTLKMILLMHPKKNRH